MNETNQLIEEQFKKLPSGLRWAINNVPWKASVMEIGKANALDPEQIASLEQEVMLVMYGFEDPNDFVANVAREVGPNNGSAPVSFFSQAFLLLASRADTRSPKNIQLIHQLPTMRQSFLESIWSG